MKLYTKLFISLMVLLISKSALANVSRANVTVSPNQTNNFATYTIASTTGNGNTDLNANQDSIIIVFNASTNVPNNITPSLITVNNNTVNTLTVSGQRLSIITPVNIAKNGGPFTVVIDAGAKIKNPLTSSTTYTLQVATTKEPTLVTSNNYTITQSSSTVSAAAVTPNPSVATEAAAYDVAFNVGSGGFLNSATSTITIWFPTGTYIPSGALSGVTVNGTSATANALNDSVVITTPVDVENNGSVQISFALGTGFKNPTVDSTYTVDVKTSSESTYITSDSYLISPAGQLSISAITTKPDTVNQSGVFEFEFRTGSTGALTAEQDSVTIIFAPNTYLPSGMSPSNVTLSSGGFTDNVHAIEVINNVSTDDDTVKLVTPFDIGNSVNVSVTFNSSAGYLNPSVAGNYKIKLRTTNDTQTVESNPFSVFNTTTEVSQAIVTPGVTTTGTTTFYQVDFSLGTLGRLKLGESIITITFDNAYTLNTNNLVYDLTRISVDGGSYVTINTADITPNNTAKTVQITIPQSVVTQNSDNISLIIDGVATDPIQNPNSQGNYVIGVKTSVEPTNVNSATYNIGGTPITLNTVTLSDATVNGPSTYTFNITTQSQLRHNQNDYVKIIFPEGTDMPSGIDSTEIVISGQIASAVSVNQPLRTVTANVSQVISGGATFDIVVSNISGINNPAVPSNSFYKVTINTSKDQVPVTSAAYSITGDATSVTVNSVTANPSVIDASGASYTIDFTTSTTGKIVGGAAAGSSTILVTFGQTVVPASISSSAVEINSIPSQAVSVVSTNSPALGGVVEITMPVGSSVANSTVATVVFDTSAGLQNGPTNGSSSLSVHTSSDTTDANGTLTLTTSQSLSVSSVTANPATQNAVAGYSIKFTTGSPGALSAGDTVKIAFPYNTGLPAAMSTSDLTVNGSNPGVTPLIVGDSLYIAVPEAITILEEVTILINQSAGILNPTFVGSYTMDVSTATEAGPFTSPNYSIVQTSTTVSAANVIVETPTPSSLSKYTISFSTGSNGRLVADTSTVTITFNASTTISNDSTVYNNTSIVLGTDTTAVPVANISVSGQAVTLKIPTGVNIGNSTNLSVIIDGTTKPITNPTTSDDYTLQVKTSIESSNISSNTYTISNITEVTNVTVSVTTTTVNANSAYQVDFYVQNALSAGAGTITLTFPSNTFVPSSISTSFVTVAHGNPTPGTGVTANAVVTNPSTRTVTITVPEAILANDAVRVNFTAGAGLENPSIAGTYTLQAKTSAQPLNATSAGYSITSTVTTIVNLQVSVDPLLVSTVGQYTFTFTTGANGKLVSGTSTITLLFPDDATFTLGTPATSKVTVNATAADAVVLNTGTATNPDTLIVTVPSSVTIGNNTDVTVIISETAGLQNASTTTALTYKAFTSVETGEASYDYSLPVELTSFDVKSDYGRAILNWITESELENAYWIIERKELTKSEFEAINAGEMSIAQAGSQFEEISRVEGRGNTAARSEYSLVDSLVQVDDIYSYRLADVSYNGVVTFHAAVIVKVNAPQSFELMQNYPNPFNPNTTIKFRLPVVSDIKLKVFNILGQEVVTLAEGVKKAGYYSMQWNGRNKNNQTVATGVYLYVIIARALDGSSEYKNVNKMVLIR
jgi:hypothetical protein